MEVTGNSTNEKKLFRSSYLNALSEKFRKASAQNEMHKGVLKLAQENYKGDKLQSLTAEQNRQNAEESARLLQEIDTLALQELDRLEAARKSWRTETGEDELDIITRLEKTADILTENELQSMADTYKDSDLVQRKLRKVAGGRGFHIDTYPGYDKKTETVRQTAADIKSFIHSGDFGLTPEIYISMSMKEADDILCPAGKEPENTEKEAERHDNT